MIKEKNDSEAIAAKRSKENTEDVEDSLKWIKNDVKIFLIDGGMKYDRDNIGVICQESTTVLRETY